MPRKISENLEVGKKGTDVKKFYPEEAGSNKNAEPF